MSYVECVQLPSDLTASVLLRNSGIRLGLSLDASLYFPGHGACLSHRVTNVSGSVIALDRSKGIAQVAFQHVDGTVANPYEGTFFDELDFSAAAATLTYMQESSKRLKKREKKLGISSRVATGLSDEISTVRFIALKVEHTYEVAELCDRIARGESLSPADVDLAVFG